MSAAGGPFELVVYSRKGVEVFALPPGSQLTVGRDEESRICVEDVAVSRQHAIVHAGPPVEIEDLGSANGTYLSRRALRVGSTSTADQTRLSKKRASLGVGDTVSFGGALVVLRRSSDAAPAALEGVRSTEMVEVYDDAAKAAKVALPVLIVGETGVGKDVLAQWIHKASPRKDAPFLALNCAALPESLCESELFGHEKGAFTGAHQARAGLFEAADKGTVFLDEIGELAPATQAKLLRVLESGELVRVGSVRRIKVDVRFVAATNKDLEAAAAAGTFRQDLYFRLNGLTLAIPPLRERRLEIPSLADHFLAIACRQMDSSLVAIAPATSSALESYDWPGNIRELRNVIERAVVLSAGATIQPQHLPPKLRSRTPLAATTPRSEARTPDDDAPSDRAPSRAATDIAERERIVDALARADGNQTRAADLLGVSRRTLINRMIEFALPRPRKR